MLSNALHGWTQQFLGLRQAFANIKIIMPAEFAGATPDSAKRAAASLLSQ
jgi:hypothetical protein